MRPASGKVNRKISLPEPLQESSFTPYGSYQTTNWLGPQLLMGQGNVRFISEGLAHGYLSD